MQDRRGPTINSILEVNPDALALSDALDQELQEKGSRGPLHGIPVLVKDNIGAGDRMHTSAGSLALADFRAPEGAFVVRKLREAGCVVLGKSNMSEWANARGRASIGGSSGPDGHHPHLFHPGYRRSHGKDGEGRGHPPVRHGGPGGAP